MKQLSGKAFAKVIERHGWKLLPVHRQSSHLWEPDSTVRLSIPLHGNQPLKRGLAAHLRKMAGLSEADFE
jgi:predicted RNA binding protein YcfA (HicA-like mRNA interferase family)